MSPPARAPHRVLIIDDSAVARQAVARSVRDAGMVVAGLARNGRDGLDQIAEAAPDLVVLDLEMPEMDGMEFLRHLRRRDRRLPVVVFSALSAQGAEATLAALAAGATAYALKPTSLAGTASGDVNSELVPVINSVLQRDLVTQAPAPAAPRPRRVSGRPDVVVIAVSTGGPNALAAVIAELPANLSVPVMIVQHMPATFTSLLAQRLDKISALSVLEGHQGQPVDAGHVYVAPGGRHMGVERRDSAVRIDIHDGPRENSCRPAADVLFRTAADAYGSGVLGVVLTGMGQDGLAGSHAIVAAGGTVVVQDPATAVVGTMPDSVARAGLADAVVPLDGIAAEIVTRTVGARRNP
ncbi:MAG: chemotaxis-specific protein-glutamate methyltransferase CheB [Candidatus Nanopelagicales bacterium]